MYLCDLGLGASAGADIPQGHTREEFNFSTTAVQEIFLTFLPAKYVLDGSRKANVLLGPSGGLPQYTQALGVNLYHVPDFDFRAYFAASLPQQTEMLLAVLEASLLDIASRSGADPAPLKEAIAATRACGCERRCERPKLAKSTASRQFKLNVFRHIVPGGERWEIDVTNRKGEVLVTESITRQTNFTEASYNYRKSAVQGDDFVLLDSAGEVSYRLNLKDLERRLT